MITDKNMDRVSLVCYATVSHMFAVFLNQKHQGPQFRWIDFPQMMRDQCRVHVFLANVCGKDQQAIYDHAEKTGEQIANHMLQWSGLLNGS